MATPEKKISAFGVVSLGEDGYIVGNQNAGGPTGRIPVSTMRSRINSADQIITGDITHTGDSVQTGDAEVVGSHKATSYEGNGSLITGVTAAGAGGTSSTSSLSLVCNSANGTPLAKIVASKYSTDIFKADETGFEVQTGIPYSHADASIPFNKDLDLQNKYLLRSQTIQNLKPFQYLHFDGVDDSCSSISDTEVDITTKDYSILWWFRSTDVSTNMFRKRTAGAGYIVGFTASGKVSFIEDSGSLVEVESDSAKNDGSWHSAVVTAIRGTSLKLYIDCKLQSDTEVSSINSLTNTNILALGWDESTTYYSGDLSEITIVNKALSEQEIKNICSPLSVTNWKYEGASQTVLTSGTVVVGKEYSTDLFVAGDDFSNVADIGALANVTGAVWIATGTTPTTWTNSSQIRSLGETFRLRSQDIVSDKGGDGVLWLDSVHDNNAAISGAVVGNKSKTDLPYSGTWTPDNGDFGTWTSPVFTAEYAKDGLQVTLTLKQTSGTIDPGAAGKYIIGVPFTPSSIATGYASSTAYADYGPIKLNTDGKLYFVNDIGPVTDLEFSITYKTIE